MELKVLRECIASKVVEDVYNMDISRFQSTAIGLLHLFVDKTKESQHAQNANTEIEQEIKENELVVAEFIADRREDNTPSENNKENVIDQEVDMDNQLQVEAGIIA